MYTKNIYLLQTGKLYFACGTSIEYNNNDMGYKYTFLFYDDEDSKKKIRQKKKRKIYSPTSLIQMDIYKHVRVIDIFAPFLLNFFLNFHGQILTL